MVTPAQERALTRILKRSYDGWNDMMCEVGATHRFGCVDV